MERVIFENLMSGKKEMIGWTDLTSKTYKHHVKMLVDRCIRSGRGAAVYRLRIGNVRIVAITNFNDFGCREVSICTYNEGDEKRIVRYFSFTHHVLYKLLVNDLFRQVENLMYTDEGLFTVVRDGLFSGSDKLIVYEYREEMCYIVDLWVVLYFVGLNNYETVYDIFQKYGVYPTGNRNCPLMNGTMEDFDKIFRKEVAIF